MARLDYSTVSGDLVQKGCEDFRRSDVGVVAGVDLVVAPALALGALVELPEAIVRRGARAIDVVARQRQVAIAKAQFLVEGPERLRHAARQGPSLVSLRRVGRHRVDGQLPAFAVGARGLGHCLAPVGIQVEQAFSVPTYRCRSDKRIGIEGNLAIASPA